MTQTFHELVIGGVLVAPIVAYAAVTLALIAVVRPVLHRVAFSNMFSNPSLAELSLYVTMFCLLTLLV